MEGDAVRLAFSLLPDGAEALLEFLDRVRPPAQG